MVSKPNPAKISTEYSALLWQHYKIGKTKTLLFLLVDLNPYRILRSKSPKSQFRLLEVWFVKHGFTNWIRAYNTSK